MVTKSGVNRKTTPVAEFRKKCEEYALKQVEKQKEQRVVNGFNTGTRTMKSEKYPSRARQKEIDRKEVY